MIARFLKRSLKLIHLSGAFVLTASFLAVIVLPTTFAILGAGLFAPIPPWAWCILVLMQLALGWVALRGGHYLKLLSTVIQVESVEQSKLNLQRVLTQISTIQFSLDVLNEYILNRSDGLQPNVAKLIEPLDIYRDKALGFHKGSAIFSASIFLLEETTLRIQARVKDSRLILTNPEQLGRTLQVNEGHAGIAFANNRIWISPDAADERMLFPEDPTSSKGHVETMRQRDLRYYRSFMSIPFGGEQPVGVLTITSSERGQFTEAEYFVFCKIYQRLLTIFYTFFPHRIN
jgi:hypothetical protein